MLVSADGGQEWHISHDLDPAFSHEVDVLAKLILPTDDRVRGHPENLAFRTHQEQDVWVHVVAQVALAHELHRVLNLSPLGVPDQFIEDSGSQGQAEGLLERGREEACLER